MRRFLISRENITDDIVLIRGQEARHIGRTLRLKPGECLHLFDRDGGWYEGRILEISRESVSVRVVVRHEADHENGSGISLCLGITKGKLMDYTVQKCTELGVERIIPFMSSRCIPRWASEKALQKGRHWQAVAEAAVKQSGVRQVPTVEPVIDFTALMQRSFAGCLKVFLWELEHGVTLKTVLDGSVPDGGIVIVVGPEGGFSEAEAQAARAGGFTVAGLGRLILRAETVPVAVSAIIRYAQGDLG